MSLRPLNRKIAKSHLSVRQGLLQAWWLLNRLCHCDLWIGRLPSLTFSLQGYFELGGFWIGYVIATSELADSQVSPFSPTRTISSFVASQSVTLLRPLNRQIANSHLSVDKDYFELGGFLISYVIATSEPADSQVSLFSLVRTIFLKWLQYNLEATIHKKKQVKNTTGESK